MWHNARHEILNSSESSSIYIGCDSQIYARKKNGKTSYYADYSTVVILHKDSMRGCKIFHNSMSVEDHGSLETRLLMEVQQSLEAFEQIKDVIGNRHIEIHLDVNPDPRYASNKITAQALGWVRGMGIEAKIKPDGFAATHAADHCVRRKSLFKDY